MRKDTLIQNFNKIFRTDPYVLSLVNSLGIEMDTAEELAQKIYLNMFFDTMTEDLGIPIYAKTLGINLQENITLEKKRSIIAVKWKSKWKCTEELLQAAADSWKNGEIEVSYKDNVIVCFFVNVGGKPEDFDNLKLAIDKVKPAHLLVEYIYFNTYGLLKKYTYGYLKQFTYKQVKDGVLG